MPSSSSSIEVRSRTTLAQAIGGSLLLWSAFPPLGIWPLAFVGLFLWLRLIAERDAFARPKTFRAVWIGSFLFWLGTDYFVTMPHWAGFFGWIAMSAYLAIYFPFFFATSRVLVHRFRVPLIIAAPICWVGMEWLRAHVITGFGMAMLPHAMYQHPLLIQTADIIGGYGTSFLMVFVSAAAVSAFSRSPKRKAAKSDSSPSPQREPVESTSSPSLQRGAVDPISFPSPRWGGLGRGDSIATTSASGTLFLHRIGFAVAGLATIAFALVYGAWRLSYVPSQERPPVPVALIQASRDVRFELTPEQAEREWQTQFREYRDLTVKARKRWPDLKLVIWPESAFPQVDAIPLDDEVQLSAGLRSSISDMRRAAKICSKIGIGVVPMDGDSPSQELFGEPVPLLTGGHGFDMARKKEFNSGFMFDRSGEICFRYHKMHLVMFGEYVPFGELFPFVYQLMPIKGGLAEGTEPKTFEIDGLRFSPSICFETTVGHLIRRQVVQLKSAGQEPDALVNLTNDGWFYGSNCLDLHLACNVFRAVELRKSMLVAANTGFSAHIDGGGRLLDVGPRRKTDILRADLQADGRVSPYLVVADWPAIALTLISLAALACGILTIRSNNDSSSSNDVEF